jgi:ribosome-binding ATPase
VRAGKPARFAELGADETTQFRALQLLTAKPVLYVCNVDEASAAGDRWSRQVEAKARAEGGGCVTISAKLEAEFAQLAPEDRAAFLGELGLAEPGLNRVIREGYRVLGLITFFTVGPKEAHAWTVVAGTRAAKAAGVIHSDFERGFIRAEIIAYDDFVALGGEAAAKAAGKMRLEGKDYVVRDGDVIYVRFAN